MLAPSPSVSRFSSATAFFNDDDDFDDEGATVEELLRRDCLTLEDSVADHAKVGSAAVATAEVAETKGTLRSPLSSSSSFWW